MALPCACQSLCYQILAHHLRIDDRILGHINHQITLDGGGIDYDHVADFVPFPAESWRGTGWRLAPGGAPWTLLEAENSHPNGTNSAPNEEHWTVRRWTAEGLDGESAVRISWSTRKVNPNGDGVTGAVHLNGERLDSAVVSDTCRFHDTYWLDLYSGDYSGCQFCYECLGQLGRLDGN